MIFEYRCYHIAPGQSKALHEHMEHRALPLFERLGIRPIAFWTPEVGRVWDRLHYIVPYADYADRAERWGAWLNHPDRPFGVAEDGTNFLDRVVSEIWEPTDYSDAPKMGATAGRTPSWIYEFHRHEIRRDVGGYHEAWRQALRLMHKHDIQPLGFWTTAVGSAPTLNYIVPFESFPARKEKMAAYLSDPEKTYGIASDGKPFTRNDTIEIWRTTPYSSY